jgi:hypothetical protein
MKKFNFILIISLCISFLSNGQEKKYFEGELLYRNFENYSPKMLKATNCINYNGARYVRIIIKGSSIHEIDETMHIHTLILPDQNKVIVYSDLLKKGQEYFYNDYLTTEHNMLPTNQKKEHNGELCDVYQFHRDTTIYSGTSINLKFDNEQWLSTKYNVYKSYWEIFNCTNVFGIVTKGVINVKTHAKIFGDMNSFVASELKDIKERSVSTEEISIPEGYNITPATSANESLNGVVKLWKENTKYLKQNNMYPVQKNSEVTYQIDKNWDF